MRVDLISKRLCVFAFLSFLPLLTACVSNGEKSGPDPRSALRALHECRPYLPYKSGFLGRVIGQDIIVVSGGRVLCVNSDLMDQAEEPLSEVDFTRLKTIVIRSQGGKAVISRKYGHLIYDNEIDIVVEGFCISACANHWFPAARYKYLAQLGFTASGDPVFSPVFYHGGYYSPEFIEKSAAKGELEGKHLAYWRKRSRLEKEFYDKIAVNPHISIDCPRREKPKLCKRFVNRDPSAVWGYTIEEFADYGVDHVYELLDDEMVFIRQTSEETAENKKTGKTHPEVLP